jgi:hypothetical protein
MVIKHSKSWLVVYSALTWYMSDIKWNAAGTFLGSITSDLLPGPKPGEMDDCNLQFQAILVAPLLHGTEINYSGYNTAGVNEDDLGQTIDTFAHSVWITQQRTWYLPICKVSGLSCSKHSLI